MATGNKKLTVAEFLTQELKVCGKTQKDVAKEAGFDNPNIITMLKKGHTKVPLERIGPLATAMGIDPAHLMRMVFEEYAPDTWQAVEQTLGRMLLSEDEERLVRVFREMSIDDLADHHSVVGKTV